MKLILPVQVLFLLVLSSPLFGDDNAAWVGTYSPTPAWIQGQSSQRSGRNQSPPMETLSRVSVSLRSNMTFKARLPIGDFAGTLTINGVDTAGYLGLSLTAAPAARGSPGRVLKASYKDGVLLLRTPFATIPFERADTKLGGEP